jgi:hypothetical protein
VGEIDGCATDLNGVMADPKGGKTSPDVAGANAGNIINMAMEDLSDMDQSELELELQWELRKRWKRDIGRSWRASRRRMAALSRRATLCKHRGW